MYHKKKKSFSICINCVVQQKRVWMRNVPVTKNHQPGVGSTTGSGTGLLPGPGAKRPRHCGRGQWWLEFRGGRGARRWPVHRTVVEGPREGLQQVRDLRIRRAARTVLPTRVTLQQGNFVMLLRGKSLSHYTGTVLVYYGIFSPPRLRYKIPRIIFTTWCKYPGIFRCEGWYFANTHRKISYIICLNVYCFH